MAGVMGMAKAQPKTFFLFGDRVSEATRDAMKKQLGYEEIPADFGPFGSGAVFCELFPIRKDERAQKTSEELKQRFQDLSAKLLGSHVIFVSSTGEMPNVADSVECVRAATETLKRYGVGEITLAMPNCAYERQDRGFEEDGRMCSVSGEWFPRDLKARCADRVLTFTPHSEDTIKHWQKAFGKGNYHPLPATDLFIDNIKLSYTDIKDVVIGAPDGADKPNDQGQARARQLASALMGEDAAESHLFKIKKTHPNPENPSETKSEFVSGDVKGKDCIVVDDMSDSGGTLINAAKCLREQGARSVSIYITHGIFIGSALAKLADVKDDHGHDLIDRIAVTDSLPEIVDKRAALPPEAQEKVDIVSVGPALASAIERIAQQQTNFTGRFGGSQQRIVGH